MKGTLVYFFMLMSVSCFSQGSRSDTIRTLQAIIREQNCISTPGVGYAGSPSAPWYAAVFLISQASTDELLRMTHDTSAGLRVCAFAGLSYQHYPGLQKLKKEMAKDTAVLRSIEGCVIGEISAGFAVNFVERWMAKETMDKLWKRIAAEPAYRKNLYHALVNKERPEPY